MTQGGPRNEPDGGDFRCEEARRLIALVVGHSLGSQASGALRTHLASCPDCSRAYREAMASAANLGRALRDKRQRVVRAVRHAEHRRLARGAGSSRTSRFGLRLFLTAAGMFFLVSQLAPLRFGGSGFMARFGGGEVSAAGTVLSQGEPEVALERGDWCVTGVASRASIRGRSSVLELGDETELLVESPGVPRVRLQRGALDVRGPCVITTQLGVIEIEEGESRLVLRTGVLSLECKSGGLRITTPTGRLELAPGDERQVEL